VSNPYQPQRKMLSQIRKCVKYIDEPWAVTPSLVEISPSGRCNHKCSHCMYADSHDGSMLDWDSIRRLIEDLAEMETKAIIWSGGGEPLLSDVIYDGMSHAKNFSLKQGLNTNGYFLDDDALAIKILQTHDWVRVSLDALTRKTYEKIHGVDHWDKVIDNIIHFTDLQREMNNWNCKIGVGIVASMHNWCELTESRVKLLMDTLRLDNFQIKPSVRQEDWLDDWQFGYAMSKIKKIGKRYDKVSSTDYKWDAIGQTRTYDYCGAAHFLSYVDAKGDVYPCSSLQNDKKWIMGNINHESFKDIWYSPYRMIKVSNLDGERHESLPYCPQACRGNEINKFLHELTHSDVLHKEFI